MVTALHNSPPALDRPSESIPFGKGIADGRMYEPRQVPIGKRCGCVCPACSRPIYAKHCQGGKRAPHFAHAPGADCAVGAETAIHLAAKQIIETRKLFFFPKLIASVEIDDAIVGVRAASRILRPDGRRRLFHVDVEQAVASIRPDLIVHSEDVGTVAIEIAVTHFVDEVKRSVFADQGLAVVEVDLSAMREVTFSALEKLLLDSCEHSEWVHHPAVAPAQNELHQQLCAAVEECRARYAARQQRLKERVAQEAAERRRQARELERQAIRAKIEREANEAARAAASLEKTAVFKAADEVRKRSILESWFENGSLPGTLQAEAHWANSFGIQDAHIWQTAVFIGLIHKRPAKGAFVLTVDTAFSWMQQRFDSPPFRRESDEFALREYFDILAARGALVAKPQGYFHLGVADLASFHHLQELFKNQASEPAELAQRVAWVDQHEWPRADQRDVIALVMSGAQSLTGAWSKLTRIEDGAREVTPLQVCQWGSSLGLNEAITLEFLVRAGYVRFIA